MQRIPMPLDNEACQKLTSLRASNRKLIEEYLVIKGAADYETRLALMADDVMYEQVFTMQNMPERTCGKNRVRRRFEDNAKCWDEFEYSNIRIFETDRPDTFLVECDADGTIANPMFKKERSPRRYHNYYWIMFVLREGRIWQQRQFTSPLKLMHDFWKEVPNSCG